MKSRAMRIMHRANFGSMLKLHRQKEGRAATILIVSLIISVVLVFFGASGMLLEGHISLNVLAFSIAAILVLFNPVLAMRWKRVGTAGFLLLCEIYFFLAFLAAHNGGTVAPAFIWNAFLPLLAIYLLGPPGGFATVLAVVSELGLFLFLESHGHMFRHSVPDSVLSRVRILTLLTLPAMAWMIGSTFEISRIRALDASHRALRFLRKANRSLRIARDEAFRANRAKDAFLANMSHEIRTPMQTILGFTEALQEMHPEKQQKEYLSIIHASASSLLAFLNEILDVSRLKSGEMRLEEVAYDFHETIARIILVFQKRFESRNLFLKYTILPGTPGQVIGDPRRLSEILINLLENAFRFTESGGTTVLVEPASDDPSRDTGAGERLWLRICVADSGIGVPREMHREIFQSFRQGDPSTARNFGGAGLGLAIVDGIVHLMGGSIQLESPVADPVAPNEAPGSKFTVLLPVREAKIESHPSEEGATPAPELAVAARILVAEDNPDNQLLMKRFLSRDNLRVDFASNGKEALHFALENHYDLVLMDLQMPIMDGIDACKEIRKAGLTDLPIIALTANAFETDRQRAYEAGMNGFLPKPFHRTELLALLDRWLHKGTVSDGSHEES